MTMTEPRTAEPVELMLEQRFGAGLGGLKRVRAAVLDTARRCGFADLAARDVALAVDEACKNIIVHAYGGESPDDIVLRIFRCPTGIVVQLRDFAPAVDPARIAPRALGDLRPGKLGTRFIRAIMDSAEFLPPPDGRGNLLQLVKRLE
jgi:anti-sigma regulatory factor (Ser/Thr protein kinase)